MSQITSVYVPIKVAILKSPFAFSYMAIVGWEIVPMSEILSRAARVVKIIPLDTCFHNPGHKYGKF